MTSSREALDWLGRFPFGDDLTDAAYDVIRENVTEFAAPAGQVLLDEGASCDPVLLLDQGTIRVYKRASEGRAITLYRVKPGELCVLAVTSALGDQPYAATAAVSEEIRGFALPVATFRRLFAEQAPLQRFVMQLVAQRIAVVMTAVVEIGFQSLDRRLARFLLDVGGDDSTRATVKLSHEEIAGELGTVREVVTRVLDTFEDEGLVRLGRRRIDLARVSDLRDLASGARKPARKPDHEGPL